MCACACACVCAPVEAGDAEDRDDGGDEDGADEEGVDRHPEEEREPVLVKHTSQIRANTGKKSSGQMSTATPRKSANPYWSNTQQ